MARSQCTSAKETLSTTSHMSIPLMLTSKNCDDDDDDEEDDDDDFGADVELSQCVYCPTWTIGSFWWTKLNCWSVKHCQGSNYDGKVMTKWQTSLGALLNGVQCLKQLNQIMIEKPFSGVVLVEPEYLKDRKVYGHVLAAFR